MFEFLLIVVAILAIIGLAVFGIRWYLSRGEDEDNNYSERYLPRHQGKYGAREPTRHGGQVTYPRPGTRNLGYEYKDSEIEAIKIRLASLERLVGFLKADLAQLYGERRAGQPQSSLIVRHYEQERLSNDSGYPAQRSESGSQTSDPYRTACEAYMKLSAEGLRGLPIEPVFAVLDIDSSAMSSAIGEAKRNFKQSDNKQSAFVIFRGGATDGWLFPNPRISFTEAMKYVFPNFSYENFEEAKNAVDPKRVRTMTEGAWEIIAS